MPVWFKYKFMKSVFLLCKQLVFAVMIVLLFGGFATKQLNNQSGVIHVFDCNFDGYHLVAKDPSTIEEGLNRLNSQFIYQGLPTTWKTSPGDFVSNGLSPQLTKGLSPFMCYSDHNFTFLEKNNDTTLIRVSIKFPERTLSDMDTQSPGLFAGGSFPLGFKRVQEDYNGYNCGVGWSSDCPYSEDQAFYITVEIFGKREDGSFGVAKYYQSSVTPFYKDNGTITFDVVDKAHKNIRGHFAGTVSRIMSKGDCLENGHKKTDWMCDGSYFSIDTKNINADFNLIYKVTE
jgi:hypothetical protein